MRDALFYQLTEALEPKKLIVSVTTEYTLNWETSIMNWQYDARSFAGRDHHIVTSADHFWRC